MPLPAAADRPNNVRTMCHLAHSFCVLRRRFCVRIPSQSVARVRVAAPAYIQVPCWRCPAFPLPTPLAPQPPCSHQTLPGRRGAGGVDKLGGSFLEARVYRGGGADPVSPQGKHARVPRPWLAGLSATTATAYDHSAITTGLLEQPRVLLPSIYFRSSLQ
jgi:hypothetical protein